MSDLPDPILTETVLLTHNCRITVNGNILTVQTDLSKIIGIHSAGNIEIANTNKIVDSGNRKYFVSFVVIEKKAKTHENFTKRRLAHKRNITHKPA
jgi:hypothetical protein